MTSPQGVATTCELVVLDFETTGLTPAYDRTIEVAATLLVNHRPVETFHQLMHPGMKLPPFITSLTGITDAMLCGQLWFRVPVTSMTMTARRMGNRWLTFTVYVAD